MSEFNYYVEHVIARKEIGDRTYEIILYLNAKTPHKYDYSFNSYNTKSKKGGGIGRESLDQLIIDYNNAGVNNE